MNYKIQKDKLDFEKRKYLDEQVRQAKIDQDNYNQRMIQRSKENFYKILERTYPDWEEIITSKDFLLFINDMTYTKWFTGTPKNIGKEIQPLPDACFRTYEKNIIYTKKGTIASIVVKPLAPAPLLLLIKRYKSNALFLKNLDEVEKNIPDVKQIIENKKFQTWVTENIYRNKRWQEEIGTAEKLESFIMTWVRKTKKEEEEKRVQRLQNAPPPKKNPEKKPPKERDEYEWK